VTYVLDAAAVIDLLVRSQPGERVRQLLADGDERILVTVAHLDAEVFSGLARLHRAGQLTAEEVSGLIDRLGSLAMRRMPMTIQLLRAAWDMRDNVAARDALYVAAAEGLQAKLVTTDDRLARAVPHLAVP
jgi:predicted nucleic acid-binding protein